LHGMQEVSGSIPLTSTNQELPHRNGAGATNKTQHQVL
jgi:hypothetical protein